MSSYIVPGYNSGPDELYPADSYFTSDISQGVKLRITDTDSKEKPVSIYTVFKNTVNRNPNYVALAFKTTPNGPWCKFSYLEYWKVVYKAAKSYIRIGLEVNECVGIIGFNSPEWFISFLGAIFAGGIGVGIYTTNSPEACEYVIHDSQIRVVVVENKQQLDKIIKVKERTNVRLIIQYSGMVENDYDGLVINWNQFINYGQNLNDNEVDQRVKTIAPNKCASLIYTSGTTGNPKAAMISHDSLTFNSKYLPENLAKMRKNYERIISYLPLSHIAAQAVDIFSSLYLGSTVYFAQPDALRGSLNKTIQEVRPTFFFGVPRVWEKMQDAIEKSLSGLTGNKLKLFIWARKVATSQIYCNFYGQRKNSLSYSMANKLLLKTIHKRLGLDQCKLFYSGAAPITKETLEFFIGLGIPLCETYGMSETTGPHNLGVPNLNRVTSIGALNQVNRSKILQKEADGSGELLIFGRHVFMGYLNDENKTFESFDEEGWIRTGDLVKIEDGFVYITGRLKEILITAGGENIPPVPIEDGLKAILPKLLSNCMLIGDKRKFLIILVTLKTNINLETMEPYDNLTNECIELISSLGSKSKTVSDVLNTNDPIVYKVIENGIKKANEKATSNAYKIQKFIILPRDFSLTNGELGPTLKLRRPIVNKMYSNLIEKVYLEAAKD